MKTCPVPGCTPLPNCQPHDCARCQAEDAGERAAIQTEGQDRSAYERAVALILESRRRGQMALIG